MPTLRRLVITEVEDCGARDLFYFATVPFGNTPYGHR